MRFLLTRLQIFVTLILKPSLLFKLHPNSFLSLIFLMTSLSILIENDSSILKMRWHLPAISFKRLFENHSKSIFPTSPLGSLGNVPKNCSKMIWRIYKNCEKAKNILNWYSISIIIGANYIWQNRIKKLLVWHSNDKSLSSLFLD